MQVAKNMIWRLTNPNLISSLFSGAEQKKRS